MNKLDRFFVKVAEAASDLSEGRSRRVGVVCVSDRKIVGIGHNVLDRLEFNDENVERQYMKHAMEECLNTVLFQPASHKLQVTLYTTSIPCIECARKITSWNKAIVHRVVIPMADLGHAHYSSDYNPAIDIIVQAGIGIDYYE